MGAPTSFNPEIELAQTLLGEARVTTAEISKKLSRLKTAHKLVNAKLAAADLAWLERQYLEELISHANDGAKAPSTKAIETLSTEIRLLKLAAENFAKKFWAVTAARMIAESDELFCEARIAQLQSNDANVAAAMAIAGVRDQIGGTGALITVEGGASEELQRRADALTEQAAALRREGESRLAALTEMTKGAN